MSGDFKRLFRSREESRVAGVCGGLGVYVGIDPVVVRLLWVAVSCLTGFIPGIVAYAIAWLIVPEDPAPVRAAQATSEPHEGTV